MTELTIKSDQPEAVRSELLSALENQRRMLEDSMKRTHSNLTLFEKKYNFSTYDLLQKESKATLQDDNLEWIEWIGEARMLDRLQSELDLLNDIQICS
ncbi:MAG: hypothetical protein HN521_09630 [Candidatus Latescibacteria bacterium]|jgi:hypothetical protein|nr:hypothetical protein [Candidatus Latescibacterota bacterium]